jgi:hypothetical protein
MCINIIRPYGMACSNSELHFSEHSESMTLGRTAFTSDRPVERPLPTHKQKNAHTGTQRQHIHASSGIRARDPSNQAAKTYALDHAATGTGCSLYSSPDIRTV